ncbi:MAG: hypothetical protein QM756_08280 [Polyangiaceae bacterium]
MHTSTRARAVQASLERQMPLIDVVVCSRHRDFVREVEQGSDAALALQLVLTAQGLSLDLKGYRAGADNEPYVLLSVGPSPDKSLFPKLSNRRRRPARARAHQQIRGGAARPFEPARDQVRDQIGRPVASASVRLSERRGALGARGAALERAE